MHGLLIEPEIGGQMAYIGLAVGVYGQGDIEYRHSTGTAVFYRRFMRFHERDYNQTERVRRPPTWQT